MSSRGQLVGHVFVFLIGIFVVAAILLVGYRGVTIVRGQQCTAQEAEFVRDLQTAFDTNLARGKVRTASLTLPCAADQVCFVSRSVIDGYAVTGTVPAVIATSYPAISASIQSGEQTNVFTHTTEGYEPVTAFTQAAPIADTPDGISCVDGDDVEIRFQGTGQAVLVGSP